MPGNEPAGVPAPKTEPKTQLGNFYRAHRTEVLAGAGLVAGGLWYWKSKHSSSSSSASTTGSSSDIDSATGYPAGSAADIAALQAQAQTASGAAVVPSSPGDGGSQGYGDGGGTGYSGGGGGQSTLDSELATLNTSITTLGGEIQDMPPGAPGPVGPGTEIPASPVVGSATGKTGATVSNAQNQANIEAKLAVDEKGTTKGDKASVATLKRQLSAVKARS